MQYFNKKSEVKKTKTFQDMDNVELQLILLRGSVRGAQKGAYLICEHGSHW